MRVYTTTVYTHSPATSAPASSSKPPPKKPPPGSSKRSTPILPGEPEPMMNIFGSYYDNNWVITVIPRKRHRPWQYEAEGNDHLLSSPGAADIGGLFITPLEKDFKKINPELLRDVYQQVCLSDRDVEEIFVHLSSN